MKFAHVADAHLGVRAPLQADVAGGAFLDRQLASLEEICFDAAGRGAQLLVSAGDLFDSNRVSAETSARMASLIRSHPELTFVLLPGGGRATGEVTGHDAYAIDSVYRRVEVASLAAAGSTALLTPEAPEYRHEGPDGVVRFTGGFFDLPDPVTSTATAAGGRSAAGHGAAVGEGQADHDVRWNVAVVHAGVGTYGELPSEVVAEHDADYIALGHYHRYQQIALKNGGCAVYPGPPLPFEFTNAAAAGGYILVELSGDAVAAERVEMDTPRLWRVTIADAHQWEQLLAELGKNDGALVAGYPAELQSTISRTCDRDPRVRLAAHAAVFDEADSLTRDALSRITRELELGDVAPDPVVLEEASQLVLTMLRTNGGPGIDRVILEDLERHAAESRR